VTFSLQNNLEVILAVLLFAVKVFALIDCVARDNAKFSYGDTLPKNTWLVILALAVLAHLVDFSALGLLSLLGTVAALVYLAQLRGSGH
jgi:uncharacterized protein DUF2516